MLTGIHFILTYTCNFECDHCFLHCGPRAQGTFSMEQVVGVLDEAVKLGSIEWIFYEGGEPFLFFPLLRESVRQASARGFKVGVVTNAYGAITKADARLWLEPLAAAGMSHLSVSDDAFHHGDNRDNPAALAHATAVDMGVDVACIAIEPPRVEAPAGAGAGRGRPVIGGGAKFRGRAVETLTKGLPLRPWRTLTECPYEDLAAPSRIHVDAYGHVHLCQGISMGNMWETPLSELAAAYSGHSHPICGPLLSGGPAALAEALGMTPVDGYVDECHLCYLCRKERRGVFQQLLAPAQVYGQE